MVEAHSSSCRPALLLQQLVVHILINAHLCVEMAADGKWGWR